jgi:hypothetical protein
VVALLGPSSPQTTTPAQPSCSNLLVPAASRQCTKHRHKMQTSTRGSSTLWTSSYPTSCSSQLLLVPHSECSACTTASPAATQELLQGPQHPGPAAGTSSKHHNKHSREAHELGGQALWHANTLHTSKQIAAHWQSGCQGSRTQVKVQQFGIICCCTAERLMLGVCVGSTDWVGHMLGPQAH